MLSFCDSARDRDVLITGAGAISPPGTNLQAAWSALISGATACRALSPLEVPGAQCLSPAQGIRLNGAPVDHTEVQRRCHRLAILQNLGKAYLSAVIREPVLAMTAVALDEALRHAGLMLPLHNAQRTAVLFGGSKGGLATAERLMQSLMQPSQPVRELANVLYAPADVESVAMQDRLPTADNQQPSPLLSSTDFAAAFNHAFTTDTASRLIVEATGAEGPNICPVAACATGLVSILQGAALVHSGQCDVCLVGSADAALRSSVIASFHRLQVLSRNTNAADACRPFDIDRDGFVIGDGAAVLVLESRRHARRRGARALAQILGGGWLSDPTGITQIDESGTVITELLRRSMNTVGANPSVLSVHGTGTESNDLAEARGIHRACTSNPPTCFAVKGALGHLLGAAGSVEMALVAAGIAAGLHPGTRNFQNADPRCLIPVATETRAVSRRDVWGKLSLGFGGHAACGLFGPA
ncbi:MAG: 3-oxoacyl-[acyl-carrier-protein] synthase 2 [Planctomycetota bacterium]